MTYDITTFVKDALAKGLPRDQIKNALAKAGWPTEDVSAALGAFADVDFPVPVPKRRPYLSAREAFIYLVLFTTLYISAFNFGSLLFNVVNHFLPDALVYSEQVNVSAIRMAVASLIIAFPVFFWLTWLTRKEIQRDPEKKNSKIRKWLTYLTLFIAAGVIIGDLIALIFNLLNGELTLRFMLKVLIILLISGLVFGYYLWDLKKEEAQ